MSFMPTVSALATVETAQLRELPMPAWFFGALAMGFFLLLLGVLWSFRNTASKYDTPATSNPAGPADPRDPGAHH